MIERVFWIFTGIQHLTCGIYSNVTFTLPFLLVITDLVLVQPVAAQPPDATELRAKFAAAAHDHFEIVKDEIKLGPAGVEGTYWLVQVRAKQTGIFKINYSYQYDTPHYSHVERESHLTFAPSGCRRGLIGPSTYGKYCLGDTAILPIIVNKFTDHKFSITKREYSGSDGPARTWQETPNSAPTENPARDHLKYLGYSSHKLLYRNGGYSLQIFAEFEAVSPGRFNLALNGSAGVPIMVVALGKPLTLLSLHEQVTGFSRGVSGREWASSSSGNSYHTGMHVMQPGDRIALLYGTLSRSAREERDERAAKIRPTLSDIVSAPVITTLPFFIDSTQYFNEWLVSYVPQD